MSTISKTDKTTIDEEQQLSSQIEELTRKLESVKKEKIGAKKKELAAKLEEAIKVYQSIPEESREGIWTDLGFDEGLLIGQLDLTYAPNVTSLLIAAAKRFQEAPNEWRRDLGYGQIGDALKTLNLSIRNSWRNGKPSSNGAASGGGKSEKMPEGAVLEFLKGGKTIDELIEKFASKPTVRNTMATLVSEGKVKVDKSKRPHIYTPAQEAR